MRHPPREEERRRGVDEIDRFESSGAEKRPCVVECHENHYEPTQAVDGHSALAQHRGRGLSEGCRSPGPSTRVEWCAGDNTHDDLTVYPGCRPAVDRRAAA